MTGARLILASGSPQRKWLLEDAGYQFEIVVPREEAECGICSNEGPAALVSELAELKAADVINQLAEQKQTTQPTIVVACDTVAECGGLVLGKPRDEQHARSMLEHLRGELHRVYSGLCVWPVGAIPHANMLKTQLAITELRMDSITDDNLDDYLATGLWRGKAGAFGYQDRPGWLQIVQGSESNVIGLPMELLTEMLASFD